MEEQIDLFSYSSPKFKIDKPVRLIEMFAGIGSQYAALKRLGVDVVSWKCIEWDKYAMASYNAIHGTNHETSDIQKVHAKDLEIAERDKYLYILTYSFPCQDLSLAGNQKGMAKGSGTRSGLLWEVERILEECDELPQCLLMENVPQVIGQKNIEDFQKWRSKLESLGYSNYVRILNAKDYGIPQNRNRCFMVSILGDYYYEFPKKKKLELRLKDMLDDNVEEKYYLPEDIARRLTKNMDKQISNTIRSGGKNSFDRHQWDIVKHTRIRKLTPKECWRLMGFTDEDFDKAKQVNSDSQLYKQAGNSIVVQVLEAIFGEML